MWESITGFFGSLFSPGGDYTGFFGIDFWQLLFTWGNLLILFLIIKHFLYQPVNEIKNDISDMAFLVAGQVVEKELDPKEHQRLMESFIDNIDDLQLSDRQ